MAQLTSYPAFELSVQGELSHRDSMGNYESLPRGCVQYMSAGTGARCCGVAAAKAACVAACLPTGGFAG